MKFWSPKQEKAVINKDLFNFVRVMNEEGDLTSGIDPIISDLPAERISVVSVNKNGTIAVLASKGVEEEEAESLYEEKAAIHYALKHKQMYFEHIHKLTESGFATVIPLFVRTQPLGCLIIHDQHPDDEEWGRYVVATEQIACLLFYQREQPNQAMQRMADSVTGVGNISAYSKTFRINERTLKRYGTKFSVVGVKVNNFDELNKAVGIDGGDSLLRFVADCSTEYLRDTDDVFRIESGFFIVLMSYTDVDAAVLAMERLFGLLKRRKLKFNGADIEYSLSASVLGGDVFGDVDALDAVRKDLQTNFQPWTVYRYTN